MLNENLMTWLIISAKTISRRFYWSYSLTTINADKTCGKVFTVNNIFYSTKEDALIEGRKEATRNGYNIVVEWITTEDILIEEGRRIGLES